MSKIKFTCSCPDFVKSAAKNLNAQSFSNQIDRDWHTSQAGADGYCKHIWAAILAENLLDQVEIPNDLAIPKVLQPSVKVAVERLQSNPKRGHYFGV